MSEPNLSMVLLSENPLLNLDTESVHFIDTQNTGNLHAFWSVFSRCARTDALSNAKRLENLSWRIYSQHSLPRSQERSSYPITIPRRKFSSESVPGLSTSPGSPSDDEMGTPPDSDLSTGICHMATIESPKTISSVKLETIVKSVTENNELEPLSPLPTSITLPVSRPPRPAQSHPKTEVPVTQNKDENQYETANTFPSRKDIESSTSTMPTTAANSELFDSNVLASTATTATDFSISIVRGFSKDHVSRSMRSRTQLAPPAPILKQASPQNRFNPLVRAGKKKTTTFMVGASSDGDDDHSSYGSPKPSSLTQRIQEYDNSYDHNHSESAIEDDEEEDEEIEDDWEDEDEASQQDDMFQRVPSVPSTTNIRSRRSLLTNMLHEKDRASALQNAASRSSPAIRRSRTSSHNGPLGTSPKIESSQLSRARQIPPVDQGTQAMPIALSPRTNRRNMLQTELTGSLRVHLLWERQQHPANKRLKNRGFRSEVQLSNHVSRPSTQEDTIRRNDTTIYDNGLQEYFERGW